MDRTELNRMLGVLNKSKVRFGNLRSRNQMMNRVQKIEDSYFNKEIEKEKEKVLRNLDLLNIESNSKLLLSEPEFEEINIPKRKMIFFEGR